MTVLPNVDSALDLVERYGEDSVDPVDPNAPIEPRPAPPVEKRGPSNAPESQMADYEPEVTS